MVCRRVFYVLASNALLVSASYFSKGWSPDAASQAAAASPTPRLSSLGSTGASPTGAPARFDWSKLFTAGPVASFFELTGINVTQRWEAAQQAAAVKPYDTRIPMITDDNYDELVRKGDPNDTWFMVVTLGDPRDPISKDVDAIYDQAFNVTLEANDTPHVKWGRVDYMDVTRVTTEWMVWKAPIMVVARDQGRELRFMYPSNLVMQPESIHQFLKLGRWTDIPIWTGPFAPGGSLEGVVKMYANIATPLYAMANRIPKWIFLLASGSVASLLIQLMHKVGGDEQPKKPITTTTREPAAETTNGSTPASTSGRPKRFVVKKASEVHPELSSSVMTASVVSSARMSESEGASSSPERPKAATRRSTRKVAKK